MQDKVQLLRSDSPLVIHYMLARTDRFLMVRGGDIQPQFAMRSWWFYWRWYLNSAMKQEHSTLVDGKWLIWLWDCNY